VTPHELLETLRQAGAEVFAVGDRLRVRAPRGVVTDEIRRCLAEHKPQLLAELSTAPGWPPECLDAERRFRMPHARLFPLLGGPVTTPAGPGELLQVFADRAAVRLDADPGRLTFVLPAEVCPAGAAVAGGLPTHATRVH
jgi:hypothetical protein